MGIQWSDRGPAVMGLMMINKWLQIAVSAGKIKRSDEV